MKKLTSLYVELLILIFFQSSGCAQDIFRLDTDSSRLNAINVVSNKIKLRPNDDTLYFIRATLYNLLGKNQKALDDINSALELSVGDNLDFIYLKGDILFDLGEYKSAIGYYRKGIKIDSLDWYTYIRLIEAYVKDKDYDRAMKVITKELFPLYDQKPERWVEADAIYSIPFLVYDVYTNAFFDGIKNNEVMYGLGYTSIRINRIPDAIYYLDLYREMTPEDKINYEVENLLGLCYLKEGDTIQAKRNFEIAFQHGIEVPDSVKSVIIKEEISPRVNEKRE